MLKYTEVVHYFVVGGIFSCSTLVKVIFWGLLDDVCMQECLRLRRYALKYTRA